MHNVSLKQLSSFHREFVVYSGQNLLNTEPVVESWASISNWGRRDWGRECQECESASSLGDQKRNPHGSNMREEAKRNSCNSPHNHEDSDSVPGNKLQMGINHRETSRQKLRRPNSMSITCYNDENNLNVDSPRWHFPYLSECLSAIGILQILIERIGIAYRLTL